MPAAFLIAVVMLTVIKVLRKDLSNNFLNGIEVACICPYCALVERETPYAKERLDNFPKCLKNGMRSVLQNEQ